MKFDHPLFDTSRLNLRPLSERIHDLDLSVVAPLAAKNEINKDLKAAAEQIVKARQIKAPVVLMMGAHVLRSGVQRYLIDLMENDFISCIAMNGACAIHDYEFALIGKTTENVSNYIRTGQFGFWQETGRLNHIVKKAANEGLGLGEAVGKEIEQGEYPYKEISLFAAGYRLGVLLTVHVGIGYDIVHQHPNFDGAAYGETSYRDFLRYAKVIESLQGGVVMNFGSAVMAPEIYLKALSMARNVASQKNEQINQFTVLVCDLYQLPEKYHTQPSKHIPGYYFRPWKTMLIRTVADGGESYYVKAPHNHTIPELWTAIQKLRNKK